MKQKEKMDELLPLIMCQFTLSKVRFFNGQSSVSFKFLVILSLNPGVCPAEIISENRFCPVHRVCPAEIISKNRVCPVQQKLSLQTGSVQQKIISKNRVCPAENYLYKQGLSSRKLSLKTGSVQQKLSLQTGSVQQKIISKNRVCPAENYL